MFKTLKKSGLYNNTFIFFTADNGYIHSNMQHTISIVFELVIVILRLI